MSYRKRLAKLARAMLPRVYPDFVVIIEGLEPGGPPSCTITTTFDHFMNAISVREEWHAAAP